MENLIVAFSNLPAILPISTAYNHDDFWSTATICFVAVASFVSHLFENHKHGMPGVLSLIGIYPSPRFSYFLNRLDVLGVGLTSLRFGYLCLLKYGVSLSFLINYPHLTFMLLVTICFNLMSEYDKYNPNLKFDYMITHCIWHISIFFWMDFFYLSLKN